MNNLAPRQGIFAVILLVSFCLHIVILMFSTEKQQYDYRTDKGEKIVEQLSKEAMVALANQDRISLSVLANRYQVDSDVAKLVITDSANQPLVQTGQSQTQAGQVIDQPIVQNNQMLGHAIITMRAISKGEIIGNQWLYILGSAILHSFLWIIYGYVARPTAEQLEEIGEKVQQRVALARASTVTQTQSQQDNDDSRFLHGEDPENQENDKPQKSIHDFLQSSRQEASGVTQIQQAHQTSNDASNFFGQHPNVTTGTTATPQQDGSRSELNVQTPEKPIQQSLEMQIRFFDEYHLMQRIAPELSKPYLQLCSELLTRACDSLFGSNNALINRYIKDVQVEPNFKFGESGAVVHLNGKAEQLPLAAVLLGKLVIILNQVVYEKHRELSRFALPMTVGVSLNSQFDETHRLMANFANEDGLLLLFPKSMLKVLNGQVQLKNLPNPMNISEREAVLYTGLAESFMAELIHKRDEILTASEH